MKQTVVLIHGLYMTGVDMRLLGSRIRRAGFSVHHIWYLSLLRTPAQNADRLNQFLETLEADVVHLVAHSLGGIVVTHLFDRHSQQRPGKVLMLGTPLAGSVTAVTLVERHLGFLLGKSVQRGLLGDRPKWPTGRALGMIAGDRGLGLGKLIFRKLPQPNDGTVALIETNTSEVTDHLRVPHSHFGLIFSRRVAQAISNYLKSGEFL